MKKPKDTAPQYVTKEILKKELSKLDTKIDEVEKRLESKIEFSTQSMKDYTDSRFTQLDEKIDKVQDTIKEQGRKSDRYFNGIVKMIEDITGRITGDEEQLKDHEKRIAKLEIHLIDSAD